MKIRHGQQSPVSSLLPVQLVDATRQVRVAVVTNIPAPYRMPVFNLLARDSDIDLQVFYSAQREPDRKWDLPDLMHPHTFLRERFSTRHGRFIHNNPDVFAALRAFAPGVIVTTGFNPTQLYAFAYAQLFGCKHVAMTDGTLASEASLSWVHRRVRDLVLGRSHAFVVASEGGRALFRGYGIAPEKIHFSPLCANTSVPWVGVAPCSPDLDFLFSGRLVDIKNPFFALKVAHGVALRIGRRVSMGMLGSGPLEADVRQQAAKVAQYVELRMAGHVSQADIPGWFASARVFLFPTSWDPWGVVANEACLAGVPTIVSPHAGAAGELVRDGMNGYVRPLELQQWIAAASALISDSALQSKMSAQARRLVQPYSFENAAKGIADASRMAMRHGASGQPRSALRRRRVVCVQRRLTHYRVPLFEALRQRLAAHGVDFELVFGDAAPSEVAKGDAGQIAWAIHSPNRYWLGERLCWQKALPIARGADMVIVTHENKLLFNMLIATLWRPKRLGFWGHGRNSQSGNPKGLKESFKRWTVGNADWWFAYTSLSRKAVEAKDFPHSRVSDLENAVDTTELVEQCAAVTAAQAQQFREHWGLGEGPVGLFIGSLYAEKRLAFLLEAGAAIASQVPDFHVVVMGDGPKRHLVKAAAKSAPWLRYVGAMFGAQKAVAMRVASVMLNPGLVGLGVLDAFAAGLPMVTTDCGLHSPEIAYLRHGENGLITPHNVPGFVDACVALLKQDDVRASMAKTALNDAALYTLENMVENFGDGILQALKKPGR